MDNYLKVLRNYVNFNGRAGQAEYWYFVLFNFLISIALGVVGYVIHSDLLSNLYSVAVFLPGIAVGIRRMHDVGKSGWFLLIPFYNFYLLCIEGDNGENEYGYDPKDEKI
jgi:uncharacterized membrane protein YhaH (DUF805 family)